MVCSVVVCVCVCIVFVVIVGVGVVVGVSVDVFFVVVLFLVANSVFVDVVVRAFVAVVACFRQGFSILYINAMPSAYDKIQNYIYMSCAILINDIFHCIADISRD